jgi:GT2 family glycosyltransferase/spore maturation protein CgeB
LPLIIVTGMHRSGTSLAAGVLKILGANLGPDDELMPATEDNPRGYFESSVLSHLDERVLVRLGGTWSTPPPRSVGWATSDTLDDLRLDLGAELRRAFPRPDAVAVVKDPRASLLLPFWRTVTSVDRTLLVLRRPDEVAGSLRRRDGFAADHAATLWLEHVLSAWADDPGHATVTYEELLSDPRTVAARLAAELGLPEPSSTALDSVEAFTERALQRNAGYAPEDGGGELDLAREIYEALASRTSAHDALLRALVASRRSGAVRLAEISATKQGEVETARGELETTRGALAATQGELETTRGALAAAQEERRREVGALRMQLQDLHGELHEARAAGERALAEAKDQLARRTAERDSARRQILRAQRELDRLRGRRSVRLALAAAEPLRPVFRQVRALKRGAATPSAPATEAPRPPRVPASEDAARQMHDRLRASTPAAERTSGPLVSLLVLNRDGEHHLRRLLPALATTAYQPLELILVDNASSDGSVAYAQSVNWPFDLRVVQNRENTSFSAGNNQALAEASGEYVLLLNNDVEPVHPDWLGHMVETLEAQGAGAVGARLVYPRRPGLVDNAGDLIFPDLTLQHGGIHFASTVDGIPEGRNVGAGEDPLSSAACSVHPVPAATAACLLLRRSTMLELGGLDEEYVYGTEDVDLCLRVAGSVGQVWYDGRAVLWHHEYGTQNAEGRERKRHNRISNREHFIDTWGPSLLREVLEDKLAGTGALTEEPLRVGITLTKDDVNAGWGDYYTAHELGDALTKLGWDVVYLERYGDRWYQPDEVLDVVVSLLDSFDLHRFPQSAVTVAWVRNWTHRWVAHDWFDDYDLVLVSSEPSKKIIEAESSQVAHLFPLATNPERFAPRSPDETMRSNALFVGNYWHQPREIIPALRLAGPEHDIRLHGAHWEDVPELAVTTQGPLNYELLPVAYSSVNVVIDDTAGPTKPYGAVNSRVFDALATGTLVVTDNVIGAQELFDGRLPVWQTPDDLLDLLEKVRRDPGAYAGLTAELRAHVLTHHTYAARATELRELLLQWTRADRVGIAVGVPSRDQAPSWGDYHFGRAIQKQLRRAGHPTTVELLPDWRHPRSARHACVLHLFGLSRLTRRPSQATVLWNISHPELVDEDLLSGYDVAFVASAAFAERLRPVTSTAVHVLNQATDLDRFGPTPGGPQHDLLFVGNSRGVRRRVIADLAADPPGYDVAVYGGGWTKELIDVGLVRGEHVPNDALPAYYSGAAIVLNDHWDDMRDAGFISNRIYDALACGACVVSDRVDGLDEEFDGAVTTYNDAADLRSKINELMRDPAARAALGERGRRIVQERHAFRARTDELLAHVRPLLNRSPGASLVVRAASEAVSM